MASFTHNSGLLLCVCVLRLYKSGEGAAMCAYLSCFCLGNCVSASSAAGPFQYSRHVQFLIINILGDVSLYFLYGNK